MAGYRLVTLAEAKDHLGILDTDDDVRVDRLVLNASAIVMGYVNTRLDGWTDTDGLPLVDVAGNPLRYGALVDTNGDLVLDTEGDPVDAGLSVVPGEVVAATLLLLGALDVEREGVARTGVQAEGLDPVSPAVVSLLRRYRDPTLA